MKISYTWLQSYFDEKLPPPEKLAELLTFSFAEVESVEKKGDDSILDIKVLPDRACYALSHRGVAYEVAAITGLKKKEMRWPQPKVAVTRPLKITVEAKNLCPRYMARVVEDITQKVLPWVKEHLEAIGERSINPVVDGANLVMFDMGQPLHAFDADKIEGGIIVRRARKGEKIITLDNREVQLDGSALVIADDKSPLAIAGIKGGKKAEVTANTKNIVLESANFDASYIRRTAERLGIKTEASKRYENRLSPEFAAIGIKNLSAYLFELDKNIRAGGIINSFSAPQKKHTDKLENVRMSVAREFVCRKLGMEITGTAMEQIFARLDIEYAKKGDGWTLTVPFFRGDLEISEDIVEEVGRLMGYDKIPSTLPPQAPVTEVPQSFYREWKLREILVQKGFSEVMTSSFSMLGEVEIINPKSKERRYLRADLFDGSKLRWTALEENAWRSDFLGAESIKIFEIGTVFHSRGECTMLAIGADFLKESKEVSALQFSEDILRELSFLLNHPTLERKGNRRTAWVQVDLSSVPQLSEQKKWDISIPKATAEKFAPFSSYPFVVRDVALFVSHDMEPDIVSRVIKEGAGELVVREPALFDAFTRDGKKSLAFRLVFQAFDRTLTDDEVNARMAQVYDALEKHGWQVR